MIGFVNCNRQRALQGFTLLEITISLGVIAAILVLIIEAIQVMAGGVCSNLAQSDSMTRANGTVYDIVSELRQATAYSPHFYIEQDPGIPPSITFDLVAGVDGKGNIVWGNKVSYALHVMPQPEASNIDYLRIDAGQLIRVETDSLGNSTASLVEDNVPYQFSENGISAWGFMVTQNGNALFLSLSHFADSGVTNGHAYQNVSDGSFASPRLAIVTSAGTYFLRNPQAVTNLN
jgi:hypothetical protein